MELKLMRAEGSLEFVVEMDSYNEIHHCKWFDNRPWLTSGYLHSLTSRNIFKNQSLSHTDYFSSVLIIFTVMQLCCFHLNNEIKQRPKGFLVIVTHFTLTRQGINDFQNVVVWATLPYGTV